MSLYKLPLRRKKEYLGLNKIPVWYEDSSQDSEKIFGISNLPKEFNAGKNIIKILGTESLEYLTEVSIEILDSQGEPIYWEIPDYVDFAKRRSIIVWIYPETPTGLGSITIVGTLKDSDVPSEWRDKPNVRWRRDVEVDPTSPNKDEIAFGYKPTISIEEKFKAVSRPEFSGGSNEPINVNITNVKYKSSKISQGPIDNVETYEDASKKYRDSTSNKNIWTTWNENSISTPKGLKSIANLGRDFDKSKYYSPLVKRVNKSKLKAESGGSIVTSPNGDFVAEMEGGEAVINLVAITNAVFAPATLKAESAILTGTYNYEIAQVINKHTIRLTDTIKDQAGNALISGDISGIKVFYTPPPISYSKSQKYQNFARVKMYNLEPVSGDIYKIKLYSRNQESQDNKFELVTDRILEPNNLLIDRNVEIENLEIGVLPSASLVTSYWSASSHPNGSQPASSDVQATADSTNIKRGIAVSSSQANSTIDSGFAKLQPVSGSSIYSIDTYSSSSYIFEFDIYGKTVTGNFETDGIVYICLSGSAIENRPRNNTESKMFDDVNFQGQVLHEISINDFSKTTDGTILIDDSALTFQTDNDGTLTPVFIMKGGKWAFSEIRLKPYAEAGFTPSHLEFDLPVPPAFDGTTLDFKVEFLDYLGNVSKEIAYVNNIPFQNGTQTFQQGDYNLITGSTYIGNTIGQGIEQTGKDGGSRIMSVGFEGFTNASASTGPPGFLMWSGSVLPNSGDNYNGVGLELIADSSSYFRYRTDPSELDIRTKSFFLGDPATTYISGSGTNIEISSSHFFLNSAEVITKDLFLHGISQADAFKFKNIDIATTSDVRLQTYTSPYDGNDYTRLNLTGSHDGQLVGTNPGQFVRISANIPPIGEIRITEDSITANQAYGTLLVIESAGGNLYAGRSRGHSALPSSRIDIDSDGDDWAYKSFNQSPTISGTPYSNLLQLSSGTRALLTISKFGWRIHSVSSYDAMKPNFQDGIIVTTGNSQFTGSILVKNNDIQIENGDLIIGTPTSVPANSNSPGTEGQFSFDSNYLYVATGSNGWGRIAWDGASW